MQGSEMTLNGNRDNEIGLDGQQYVPSPAERVRTQVADYEASGGVEGATLEGRPVVILTSVGAKSGKVRKNPVMRIVDGDRYVVVASAGGSPANALSAVDAAPLACAGLTMFNSLRHTGAGPGDLVVIVGIGGLGHVGAQFAVKMGFRTVDIARGPEKGELACELGAHHYIDSLAGDVAAELQNLGGARVVAATTTNADAMTTALGGLGLHGELLTLAALNDPVQVTPIRVISNSGTVHGHPASAFSDLEDTLNFAALQGIKPMVEVLPLEKAADGYQRMLANQARFRVVLTPAETSA
jgi:alcohol dehydrogenase